MSKIYKGYELIKAIADGEIKEGSEFIIKYGEFNDFHAFYKNDEIRTYLFGKEYKLTTKDFAESEFELIEDEIDIDNIEELNDTCYDEENMISEEKEYYHNLTREQQNTILRAVKQLDKRVKELEELNIEINEKDINEAINKAREQRNKEIKSIKEK